MSKTSAVAILRRRYASTPVRRSEIARERLNAEVASLVFRMRESADVTQKELAGKVGTTQSAISRLEDADYTGHSLSMLSRIAEVLGYRVKIDVAPRNEPSQEAVWPMWTEEDARIYQGLDVMPAGAMRDAAEEALVS